MTAAEISSFQLETIEKFASEGQRYPEYYTGSSESSSYDGSAISETKEKIAENQTKDDTCVLNYDDDETRRHSARHCKAKVLYFSSEHKLEQGVYLDGTGDCVQRMRQNVTEIC